MKHRFSGSTGLLAIALLATTLGVPLVSQLWAAEEKPQVKSPYTPDFTGKANIHCTCVAGTTGCASNLFWTLSGSQTHDWWQEINLQEGKSIDLDNACYRKRDAPKLGDGLCCEVDVKDGKPDETMLHHFFGVTELKRQ